MREPRRGFTVIEVMVVGILSSILAMILGATWSGFGRPSADADARCRVAQEANLAAAALARDLGGYPADAAGRLGGTADLRRVDRTPAALSMAVAAQLGLCFDGGTPPDGKAQWAAPDAVVLYEVDSGNLVRRDPVGGTSQVVAQYVQSFAATDLGGSVRVDLALSYRNIQKSYILIAVDP